jgi:hypothetical protein
MTTLAAWVAGSTYAEKKRLGDVSEVRTLHPELQASVVEGLMDDEPAWRARMDACGTDVERRVVLTAALDRIQEMIDTGEVHV